MKALALLLLLACGLDAERCAHVEPPNTCACGAAQCTICAPDAQTTLDGLGHVEWMSCPTRSEKGNP